MNLMAFCWLLLIKCQPYACTGSRCWEQKVSRIDKIDQLRVLLFLSRPCVLQLLVFVNEEKMLVVLKSIGGSFISFITRK